MEKSQQKEIATDLINGLRGNVNAKIHGIPDDWDGVEIRQWITDLAAESITYSNMPRARKAEYNNTRLIKNL